MRFLCDHMLGTLAKWLRLMGFDTAYPGPLEDDALVVMAESEDRVVLTRDKELAGRGGAKALRVRSDVLEEQLRQVVDEFRLVIEAPMSRCSACNAPVEEVPKSEVEGGVPRGVFARHDRFWRCPGCGRCYWHGSHYENIMRTLGELRS